MFTNRISKIFVVLLVLGIALVTVSFAAHSANVATTDRSYDSIEQARIASVQADRSYDSIELLRNDRHKLTLSKLDNACYNNECRYQLSNGLWVK